MARDPGSVWAPLPEAGPPDGHTKTQFIVHSTGDNATADRIRAYFARGDIVVESTFIVGLDSSDPTLQVMDSTDVADANTSANVRAIAVEVVGDGTGPFTEWQVSEIIRIGRWAAANHPIERRICPAHDASGFGWHVMFGAPGPWTTVRGKVCPGAVRIAQLKDRIFPAIFGGASTPTQSPEDDMRYLAFRNSKNGQIALAAPGQWYVVPNPAYWKLVQARGLVQPHSDGEMSKDVPDNEFGYFRDHVYLGANDQLINRAVTILKSQGLIGKPDTPPTVDPKALAQALIDAGLDVGTPEQAAEALRQVLREGVGPTGA